MVLHITNGEFSDFLLDRPLAVLYMWAEWDRRHPYMACRVERLAEMYPGANFGMMDVDANLGITTCLGIKEVPTVLFFCAGRKESSIRGSASLLTLSNRIVEASFIADERLAERTKR